MTIQWLSLLKNIYCVPGWPIVSIDLRLNGDSYSALLQYLFEPWRLFWQYLLLLTDLESNGQYWLLTVYCRPIIINIQLNDYYYWYWRVALYCDMTDDPSTVLCTAAYCVVLWLLNLCVNVIIVPSANPDITALTHCGLRLFIEELEVLWHIPADYDWWCYW